MALELRGVAKNFFNLSLIQGAGMLVQLLVIPLITRRYGLAVFGEVAVATSLASLLGNLVNYGTNQTAVKRISIYRQEKGQLAEVLSEVFFVRVLLFSGVIFLMGLFLVISGIVSIEYLRIPTGFSPLLFLTIIPFLLTELVSPVFFLSGVEKLHWVSWGSLVARLVSIALVVFIPLYSDVAPFLNLFISIPLCVYFFCLTAFILRKYDLKLYWPSWDRQIKSIRENFYVVFNNSSVILQQSIFMFTVAGMASSETLGLYGVVDKLVGATRNLISAFSASIYPRAAVLFNQHPEVWAKFRSRVQKGYFVFFLISALFLQLCAEPLSYFFIDNADSNAVLYFRFFGFIPLLIALNANNVLDLLLRESYQKLFWFSLIVLAVSVVSSLALILFFNQTAVGIYPLFMELFCLVLYSRFSRNG
ncbi:MAG: oligosaccharide flippase family protein [Cyclobacteriaceae bacterium]|jgi:PST family polysaccharide transporter